MGAALSRQASTQRAADAKRDADAARAVAGKRARTEPVAAGAGVVPPAVGAAPVGASGAARVGSDDTVPESVGSAAAPRRAPAVDHAAPALAKAPTLSTGVHTEPTGYETVAPAEEHAAEDHSVHSAKLLHLDWDDFAVLEPAMEFSGAYGRVMKMRRVCAGADTDGPGAFVAVKVPVGEADDVIASLRGEAALLKELLEYKRMGRPEDEQGWQPLVQFLGTLGPRPSAPGRHAVAFGLILEWFGEGLDKVLKRPHPPWFDAAARLKVARHVAFACRFLHHEAGYAEVGGSSEGIVHRDIKPGNVLVDEQYNAKLADFGTSRLLQAMGNGNSTMRKPAGTEWYMAPELVCDTDRAAGVATQAPKKLDVWSFGVLLYDLHKPYCPFSKPWFWGHPEYEAYVKQLHPDDVLDAFYKAFTPAPTLPVGSCAPQEVRRLLAACCTHDPAARPCFRDICAALQPVRPRLVVRYSPMVPRGSKLDVHIELRVDNATVQPDAARIEELQLEFLVPVSQGDVCAVEISPMGGDKFSWIGSTSKALLGEPLPALVSSPAEAAPLRAATLQLTPRWAKCPDDGVRGALKLKWQHAAAGGEQPPQFTSLGTLGLRLGIPPVAPARREFRRMSSVLAPKSRSDVFVSYRDSETGRTSDDQFSLGTLVPGLRARGYKVFCYADELGKGDAWVSVLIDGILASRAFIPVCSPTYADLLESPWGCNELASAVRHAAGAGEGAPHVLPLWHSGAFPPRDAGAVLGLLAKRRVPAGAASGAEMVASGDAEKLIDELVEALRAAGIEPSGPAA